MLFSGSAAMGAIVYFQPTERIRLSNLNPATQDYNIDLNGDGVYDLQHDSVGRSTFLRTYEGTRILGVRLTYEGVSWYDSLAFALPAGASIGPDSGSLYPEYGSLSGWQSEPLGAPGASSLHVRYDSGTSGFFTGARGYIGVEFLIDGEVHYGWIDLDNFTWWQSEIHGWAYETEPNKPIAAGAVPEPSVWGAAACAGAVAVGLRRRRDGSTGDG